MRVVSWLGGVVLVAVVSAATAAALHAQSDSAHALAASTSPVAAVFEGSYAGDSRSDHHVMRPNPDQSTNAPTAPQQGAEAPPRPAAAPATAIAIGSTQQALINQDRAAAGLGPLTWSGCLYNVAVSNARRMAAQGYISHANGPSVDLGCGLGHQAGENVGWWSGGINDSQLNSMFWASAGHKANILGPYRYVATAWVVAPNGYAYIAVEFS